MKIKNLVSTKRRIAAVVLTGAALAGTAAIAAAYFASSGSGTGTVPVGASSSVPPFTVSQTGAAPGALTAGAQTITFKVQNTASFSEHYAAPSASVKSVSGTGCASGTFAATVVTGGSLDTSGGTLAAGGSGTVFVTVSLSSSGSTQGSCLTKTVTVTLTA
jgi:hypothetical protein